MELIDENVAMLSNFEVFDLLSKLKQQTMGRKPNGQSQNLATVTYETLNYLSQTPCSCQDPKAIEDFLVALKPYKLTKLHRKNCMKHFRAEKLQLLNLRPTSPVEIQLVIAETEERFSEEEVAQLLEIINSVLPSQSSGCEAQATGPAGDKGQAPGMTGDEGQATGTAGDEGQAPGTVVGGAQAPGTVGGRGAECEEDGDLNAGPTMPEQ